MNDNNDKSSRRICVETDDGRLLWIPGSKLDSWEQADHESPLTAKEQEFLNMMKERIYGSSDSQAAPSPPSSKPPDTPNAKLRKLKYFIILFSAIVLILAVIIFLCFYKISGLKSENEQLQRESEFFNAFAVILPSDGTNTFHKYGCEGLDLTCGFNVYNTSLAFQKGFHPCLQCMNDGYYIGNKNSHIYHKPSCWSLPYSKNAEYFMTEEKAQDEGYRPCELCKP